MKVVWPATLLVDGIVRYQFFKQDTEYYDLDLQEQANKETLDTLDQWIQLQHQDTNASTTAVSEEISVNKSEMEASDAQSDSKQISSSATAETINSTNIYKSGPQLAPVVLLEAACSCSLLTLILTHYDTG